MSKGEEGESLMHDVARVDHPATRERLLGYAGLDDLNAQDMSRQTPLHHAAQYGSVEVL